MNNLTLETVRELESLYESYCLLDDNNSNEQVDYSFGMHTICERLIEIIRLDDIFPIVLSICHNSFDDYPYNVKKDTPEYIDAIKERINE